MSEENREEIQIDCELLPPVNKLVAIAQLFDCAAQGQLERLDEGGFIGVAEFLKSIVSEIMEISYDLNGRIGKL